MPLAATSAKSLLSTPVTLSLKVTVKCTVEAVVGSASALTIEVTVGAATSLVAVLLLVLELLEVSVAVAVYVIVPSVSALTFRPLIVQVPPEVTVVVSAWWCACRRWLRAKSWRSPGRCH